MLFPSSSIPSYLLKLGLQQNDTVMIHGNAGVAAQFIFDNSSDPIFDFNKHILDYFHEGTVIVPTYTYSATKGEIYDPKITPSAIGEFSEKFRLMKGGIRSLHPIFSVSCFGKNAKYFSNSTITDSFGEGTLFEKLYNNNVKILGLGCPLDRFLTFIHYVEQAAKVNYRYFKNFEFCLLLGPPPPFRGGSHFRGWLKLAKTQFQLVPSLSTYRRIQDEFIQKKGHIKYFVRDLELESELDLTPFENIACEQKRMVRQSFGRFYSRLISAKDCYDLALSLLRDDPYSLIREITK